MAAGQASSKRNGHVERAGLAEDFSREGLQNFVFFIMRTVAIPVEQVAPHDIWSIKVSVCSTLENPTIVLSRLMCTWEKSSIAELEMIDEARNVPRTEPRDTADGPGTCANQECSRAQQLSHAPKQKHA